MARKIKFALEMADGTKVRGSLEELREHFDLESVAGYFLSGKLVEWLDDRYYEDEADALRNLDKDTPDFNKKLCDILGVESEGAWDLDPEQLERLNEKKATLRQKTSDENIISNAAQTAFNQEDLADLLDIGTSVIYLCGEKFNIPARVGDKKYIGILGTPKVAIKANAEELEAKGIVFENVTLPWGNAAVTQSSAVDTTPQTVSAADEVVPLDELKDLYKSSFSERIEKFDCLEDKIWEICVLKSVSYIGGSYYQTNPLEEDARDAQKKMAIRLLCKNQYTENDLVHVCIMKDMTSGWVLTKNSFCIYVKGEIESIIIPYKDITSVEYSSSELCIKTSPDNEYKVEDRKVFDNDISRGLTNYLDVAKRLYPGFCVNLPNGVK